MENNIGKLIRKLRIDRGLSQEQLANLCYRSRESISKFEKGLRNPSNAVLIELSLILEFDFVTYKMNIDKFKSDEHYIITHELIKCIDLHDNDKIIMLLNSDVVKNEFNYDEPLVIKQYCHILILINVYGDINGAYNLCVSYLEIDEIKTFQPKINQYHQYYSIILNLIVCLNKMGEFENQLYLCAVTVNYLENTYFNHIIPHTSVDFFYKKYYIISLNNLADTHFYLNNLDDALKICNKGIQKSNELNILIILPMLLKLKIEIFCKLNNYCDAKSTYIQFNSFCEITNNVKYFEISTINFKKLYPSLFE